MLLEPLQKPPAALGKQKLGGKTPRVNQVVTPEPNPIKAESRVVSILMF